MGRELERLHEEGFHVFHDWNSGRGNADHFVLGPRGIFVVETKASTGEIDGKDGKLHCDGRPIPGKDLTRQAMAEAMAVRDLVRNTSGIEAFVHPVLCFSGATMSWYWPMANVEITNLGSLNCFIMSQRERYSPREVKAIARLLEKRIGVGPASGPDLPPERPNRTVAFLVQDRTLVFGILCLFLILAIVFAGTTARFLADLSILYKTISTVF